MLSYVTFFVDLYGKIDKFPYTIHLYLYYNTSKNVHCIRILCDTILRRRALDLTKEQNNFYANLLAFMSK